MTFCEMYIKLFSRQISIFPNHSSTKKEVKCDTFSISYDFLIIRNLVYILKHLLIVNITYMIKYTLFLVFKMYRAFFSFLLLWKFGNFIVISFHSIFFTQFIILSDKLK